MPNVSTSLVVLSWITRERSIPKFSSSTEAPMMPWKLRFSHFHQTDKNWGFCLLEQVTSTPEQIARMGAGSKGLAWQNSKVHTVVHACHRVKAPTGLSIDCVCVYCFILWNIPCCTCDVVVGDWGTSLKIQYVVILRGQSRRKWKGTWFWMLMGLQWNEAQSNSDTVRFLFKDFHSSNCWA